MRLPKPAMTAQDYWALPEGERAELIDGELWDLAAPSRLHQAIASELITALSNHISSHGGPAARTPRRSR
ncbi:MAG: Uma2 family endonuclease [Coriobacteriales bacterium]|jgi:Uma2 family endonuclease